MKWICLLVAFAFFACSGSRREAIYKEKINEIELKMGSDAYNGHIDDIHAVGGKFPDSLEDVFAVFKQQFESDRDIETFKIRHFIDVFSKNGEWVGYYPLYDSTDTEIVSYVILSAGIDGKLGNKLAPGEKLHMDDWAQKLALYNPDEYVGAVLRDTPVGGDQFMYTRGLRNIPPYSARDERSGKKDLLIYVHHLVYIGEK
jgi:hypothetical protein